MVPMMTSGFYGNRTAHYSTDWKCLSTALPSIPLLSLTKHPHPSEHLRKHMHSRISAGTQAIGRTLSRLLEQKTCSREGNFYSP